MSNEPLADVRDMYMVHTMLRRELGLAPALVRGVADHDIERATVVAEHLAIVDDLLDHHHRGEDANVWPRLLERAGAEAEPIVELMERQHAEIEKLLGETRDRLAEWRTTADARQGVETVRFGLVAFPVNGVLYRNTSPGRAADCIAPSILLSLTGTTGRLTGNSM